MMVVKKKEDMPHKCEWTEDKAHRNVYSNYTEARFTGMETAVIFGIAVIKDEDGPREAHKEVTIHMNHAAALAMAEMIIQGIQTVVSSGPAGVLAKLGKLGQDETKH